MKPGGNERECFFYLNSELLEGKGDTDTSFYSQQE